MKKRLGVFASAFLLLIFLSKTLYNYNLPTVSTVSGKSGTLESVVRASGILTYSSTYNVFGNNIGRIAEIYAGIGDTVKKGQLLMRFEPDEGNIDRLTLEIEKKKQSIRQMTHSAADMRRDKQLSRAQTDKHNSILNFNLSKKKEKISDIEDEIKGFEAELKDIENGSFVSAGKSAYESAVKKSEDEIKVNRILYETGAISRSLLDDAESALSLAINQYEQYKKSLADDKQALLKSAKAQLSDLHDEIALLEFEIENESAEEDFAVLDMDAQINIANLELELLEKELSQAKAANVLAEADGIVTDILAEPGGYISPNQALFKMAEISDEFAFSLLLDDAELSVLNMESSEINVSLKGIGKTYPGEVSEISYTNGGDYDVTVKIKSGGSGLAGKRAEAEIRAQSETYGFVIPNFALRKDRDGYFFLSLEQKKDVLGSRYTVTRVSVRLIDSGDISSAVDTGYSFHGLVISSSTAPVDSGDRVKYTAPE